MRCFFVLCLLLVAVVTFTNAAAHDVCVDFGKCCNGCDGGSSGCGSCCRNLQPNETGNMKLSNGHCKFPEELVCSPSECQLATCRHLRGVKQVCWCDP